MDPLNQTFDRGVTSLNYSSNTIAVKMKTGLTNKINQAMTTTSNVPNTPITQPVLPPDHTYEDPFPEKRVETGNKIASIMAEEKKRRAEFKEF